MRKIIIALYCFLTIVSCSGQSNNKNFDSFLSKFMEFNFPINPTDFIVDREAKLKTVAISENEFNEFLREKNDSFWVFKDYFEYSYGGKHKLNNYWIVFYSRHFIPDDVNLQKGEFILITFTFEGIIISSLPVAGGYGDSLTFTAKIKNPQEITIDYSKYTEGGKENYSKYYFIDDAGIIKPTVGNN